MKKNEIKKKVEQAKAKFMPTAIKEEAEYKAREEVRRALAPPLDAKTYEDPAEVQPGSPAPKTTVFAPNDPKLCGY